MPKITELDSVISLDGNDVLPIVSKNNNNEDETMKIAVNAIGTKLLNSNEYGALNTTDKKIIGAINEVNTKASQFDNMTATASGSIATFDNGGDDIPVSEFECEIVAQQASGTPTPVSPLPITGHSESDILVSGKNLFDESQIANASGWSESGGVYTGSVAQLYSYANNGFPKQPKYKSNTQYTLSVYINATNAVSRFRVYYTDSTYSDLALANNMVSTTQTHLTAPSKTIDKITFTYNAGGDLSISKIQLEEGTSASDYAPYTGNLYTVAFGQTIYGGRLIYKNGQWSIEATFAIADFSNLVKNSASATNWVYYSNQSDFDNVRRDETLCSHFPRGGLDTPATWTNISTVIYFNLDGVIGTNDVTTAKAYLANVQFVYPLATPVIIPITSATRVKTISGDNNIYSSTGDCELKYFTNKADSLAELIKAFVV